MQLDLVFEYVDISRIAWSSRTYVQDSCLYICKKDIVDLLKEDPCIEDADVEVASPGESVRIVPAKDAVEPRVKLDQAGGYFGGLLSPVETTGLGRTLVLGGVAVLTCGPLVNFQEGLVDMSGPGAAYSPFSHTHNVVILVEPVSGLEKHLHEHTVRMAGLKVAVYLASRAVGANVTRMKRYTWDPSFNALPRVGYIHMLIAQGLLHDSYVYGQDAKGILPTVISPLEAIDGAIVNGNCAAPCHKHTTYHHQNNPVVVEALERHLKEINFAGVIVSNEPVSLPGKERASTIAVNLARLLALEGIVVTEEGGGNPETDLMMVCRKAERQGIRTVLITDEYCGRDGLSQGLADTTPEADAVVTNGNGNEIITLPPMERVIGDATVIGRTTGTFPDSLLPDGSLQVEIASILGSCCELGYGRLTCVTV